jgi:hypothetical protein
MCLLVWLSFMAHGYYVAIVTMFLSGMVFFHGVAGRAERWGRFSMAAAPVLALLCVGITLSIVAFTDKYLPLRKDHPGGYDWMEQKVRFSALFSGYTFQRFSFPVMAGQLSDEPEKAAYLGNIGLYFVLVAGVAMIFNKTLRAFMLQTQRSFFKQPQLAAIAGGSVLLLAISFGENYYTADPNTSGMHFVNIFNPLLYVHVFTRAVEQFRSLERFVFPFYFGFYIWVGYTLVAVYNTYGATVKRIIIGAMLLLGGVEIADHVDKMQSSTGSDNLFSTKNMQQVLPIHIDFRKYQAVLPIPYYMVGNEEEQMSLGDYEPWITQSYQIALGAGLPLMSSKMSRTTPVHGKMMIDMVGYGIIDPLIRGKLNNKPILVAVNTRMVTDSTLYNVPRDKGVREKNYWGCNTFVQRNGLSAIDSAGDIKYYEWYPLAGR